MLDLVSISTLFIYAFSIGIFHAFEADHVAAISTFSSRANSVKSSSKLGVFWGLGHTSMLFIVGIILLLFKATIPEQVSASFEGIIGVVLLLLGISVILKVRKDKLHIHTHSHNGDTHAHLHSHKRTFLHKHEHKSFAIGLLHGLAGSGALIVLILAAANSIAESLLFIVVFGAGSIFGMTLISTLIGYFLKKINKLNRLRRLIQYSTGGFSIVVGIVLIVTNLAI